jgi:PKD repeat protein
MKKIFTSLMLLFTMASFGQVSFTYSPEKGCAPMPVQFTNTSTLGNSFEWDIDNKIYTEENPLVQVPVGNFLVSLNVYDTTGGANTFVGSTFEYLSFSGVAVSFSPSVCIGEPVEFNCFSWNGNVTSTQWHFGDGNSATDRSATHTYSAAGELPITLYVTSSDCGVDTIINYITVSGEKGFDEFISLYGPSEACPNTTVDFDAYFGQVLEVYNWNFGDGVTKVSQDSRISHKYSATGEYAVTVNGKNYCGNDTTLETTISINEDVKIEYIYMYHEEEACPNEEINFSVSIDGNSEDHTFEWNFGNGKTSTKGYPTTTYTETGKYTISLKVTNACGNDTTILSKIDVNLNKRFDYVNAYGPDSICPNDVALFEAYGDGATAYLWNFGDGGSSTLQSPSHQFGAIEGPYNVTVKLTNECGNDTTLLMFVTVSSVTSAQNQEFEFFPISEEDEYCPNDSISFIFFAQTFPSEITAFFGDGTQSSDFIKFKEEIDGDSLEFFMIKHAYSNLGDYSISIEITNGCGKTLKEDDVFQINISNEAEFEMDPDYEGDLEAGKKISFIQFSSLETTWDFGDGTTLKSDDIIVHHTYSNGGTFTVTASATNGCGFSNSDTFELEIEGPLVGINPKTSSLGLSVYPNPTNNNVNFKWNSMEDNGILTITDLAGKVIFNSTIENNEEISLAQFKTGFYLYTINVNGVSTSGKLIKQ